jgi:tripartite-type tricarboxylate transporter receptor subunit TctC
VGFDMKNSVARSAFAFVAVVATLFMSGTKGEAADVYPQRPVKIVVPYAAGGGTDVAARLFGTLLEQELGQPFIIDNRAGGASIPGTQSIALAAPDGYTLGMMDSSFVTNPSLFRGKLPYDTQRDFKPVALLARNQLLLMVPANSPYKSVGELVAAMRKRPGELTFASAGIGTAIHLAGEQLRQAEGLSFITVPYRGGGPALADLIGGKVDFSFVAYPLARAQLRDGRLKALAIAGPRMALEPDVPSMAEVGFPSVDAMTEMGLIAPAGTPDAIVQRLSAVASEAARKDPLRQKLIDLGSMPIGSTPQEFADHVGREISKWSVIIERGNVKGEP